LKTLYPDHAFIIKLWGGLMGSNQYTATPEPEKWKRIYKRKKLPKSFYLSTVLCKFTEHPDAESIPL
jgi:hypothetical protein